MKNNQSLITNPSNDYVQLSLDSFTQIEQAELLTRLLLNSNNSDRNEFIIAVSCISDLLCDVMKKTK